MNGKLGSKYDTCVAERQDYQCSGCQQAAEVLAIAGQQEEYRSLKYCEDRKNQPASGKKWLCACSGRQCEPEERQNQYGREGPQEQPSIGKHHERCQ
jgi:hypothetical protein